MASIYERLNRLPDVQLRRMGLDRSTLARDAIDAVEARDKLPPPGADDPRAEARRLDRTWSHYGDL